MQEIRKLRYGLNERDENTEAERREREKIQDTDSQWNKEERISFHFTVRGLRPSLPMP